MVIIKIYKKDINIWYTNNFKQYYYFVVASLMVNYKKQVFITNINVNMQYFLYNILQKKIEIIKVINSQIKLEIN